MPAPDFRTEHFLEALHGLMPQGPAWPREADSWQDRVLAAIADRFAAQHARIVTLADQESYPALTSEMLDDWERAYGLPDSCGSEGDSMALRRAALLARIAERGGQSPSYFIGVAAALGFTVTVHEYRPARFGEMRFGDPMAGQEWAFVWAIRAPETTVTPFRFGQGAFGDPFSSWGNDRLECVLSRIKPAHTILLFQYA